jgi:hypothetical protein
MNNETKKMRTIQVTKKLHNTVNEKRDVLKDEDGNYTYDTVQFGYDVNKLNYAK